MQAVNPLSQLLAPTYLQLQADGKGSGMFSISPQMATSLSHQYHLTHLYEHITCVKVPVLSEKIYSI
jgi:hypothetical protein